MDLPTGRAGKGSSFDRLRHVYMYSLSISTPSSLSIAFMSLRGKRNNVTIR